MSQQQVEKKKDDEHDADIVMPGFRFHPTEEELIDFYLRRKVEGKRFHVELITFLDLYRYDPWELPALAAIGEKEWFFYVPRDRKYRNGDRPNRVTTSGYWKATGADKTIKTENFETIGLKKTLVFYSGRAPKGVRSSWIMNEYRLPPNETERLQKAEISLCRVYKRTVMEEHSSLPRSLFPAARSSSSSGTTFKKNKNEPHQNQESAAMERFHTYNNATNPHDQVVIDRQTSRQINTDNNVLITSLALTKNNSHDLPLVPLSLTHSRPNSSSSSEYTGSSNINSVFPKYPSFISSHVTDDLHRLVNFQHASIYDHHHQHPDLIIPSQPQLHSHPLSLSMLTGTFQAALSDRIWDWSSLTETSNDFHTSFK